MVKINSMQARVSSLSKARERIRDMKSYSHLYERVISRENRLEAVRLAKHSPRIRKAIKESGKTEEEIAEEAYEWIVNFKNAHHKPIKIKDGMSKKERTIIVPTLEELIVQHALINVLKPIFTRSMYEHSYASLPGKGAHAGKKVIERWIRNDGRNCKYCLKMDIRHFFDSVPHDILKERIVKTFHDEKILRMMLELVDVTETGLPLGFYTSQWFSNWYLTPLDHYIKQSLKAEHYMRYMDDMVIFGSNKKKLHRVRKDIQEYLEKNLGLTLKDNWQVFRFSYIRGGREHGRDLDYMGFRFHRNRTTLRRSIMLKASRKAKKIAKKEKPSLYEIRQMLSYLGWIDATDTYRFYEAHIKPYVNFQKCKRRLSIAARRENRNGVETCRVQTVT